MTPAPAPRPRRLLWLVLGLGLIGAVWLLLATLVAPRADVDAGQYPIEETR